MIDTHCHLDAAEFSADRGAVHAAALAAGVSRIIVPGVAVDGFAQLKTTVSGLPGCRAAYGIHPLYVPQAGPDDLAILRDWLVREQPLAVGEIGLDFYVDRNNSARQTVFFVEQLKLAREFDLPVILHVRGAIDSVLKELRRLRVRGGIAHAFNGSRQQADEFVKLGFKLGFGGAATYSGSTRIRQLAATLPHEVIVLETDAPDIPPAWLNQGATKGRNAPAELPRIAAEIAGLRAVPLAVLVEQTSANARAVFGDF
jgi:TatD DNase family protein